MSEQHVSPLEFFPDEFLVENDAAISPLASGARDIKRVANGTTLEVISDAAAEAVQGSNIVPLAATGTLLASTVSQAVAPVLAAAQNFSSRGTAVHQTERVTKSGGVAAPQVDEVSFTLQPGGAIYPLAVREAPVMGVSVDEAIAQSEVASNISPSQVTDLAIGTKINFPLHYKFAIMPEGRDLDWIAAQHNMTLDQLLAVNPTYRDNPNNVLAGAAILVSKLTRTTVTPIPRSLHQIEHHMSVTSTHKSETPAPVHTAAQPVTPTEHHKVVKVTPKTHVANQPHHTSAVAPEKSKPKPKTTNSNTRIKFRLTPDLTFGSGLQSELGKAFSMGALEAEQPNRLAQNTLGHSASLGRKILEGASLSNGKRSSHTATQHPNITKRLATDSANFNIYSNVLTKSGLSEAALRYALSQMEGGAMASIAGDIHDVEQEYGINSLYVAAAGCIESACGTSNFARERNNDFGIEAYTNNPDHASRYPSQRANVIAFAKLLRDNYLHPNAPYWGGSGSLHSIYKNYSTSHDSEAHSIAEVMNTLALHASYFNAMNGAGNATTTSSTRLQPKRVSHTHRHAAKNHVKPSDTSSLEKTLAHAWNNVFG
ncbi:MAG TPA: glucosaminidase domain-containing protein [Candidatus Dormibacteraeota bacterium]|nr:glucosaminidase domain-containing protein [Candidatus Dormibacteraeota bacterium]